MLNVGLGSLKRRYFNFSPIQNVILKFQYIFKRLIKQTVILFFLVFISKKKNFLLKLNLVFVKCNFLKHKMRIKNKNILLNN